MNRARLVALAVLTGPWGCASGRSPLPPFPPRERVEVPGPAVLSRPGGEAAFGTRRYAVRQLSGGLWVLRIPADTRLAGACLIAPQAARGDVRLMHAQTVALGLLDAEPSLDAEFAGSNRAPWVSLNVVATPSALDEGLETLTRTLRSTEVASGTYRQIHLRVLKNLASGSRSAHERMTVALRRSRYGEDHPWARDAWGTLEALTDIDPEGFLVQLRRLFPDRRSVLVVVGPEADLPSFERLEHLFAGVGGERPVPPTLPPMPPRSTGGTEVHAFWYRRGQTLLRALHVGPGPQSPRRHAAFLALAEMMESRHSPMNAIYRERHGATYGTGSRVVQRANVTELFFEASITHRKTARLIDDYRAWLKSLGRGDVDRAELQRAKAQLMGAWSWVPLSARALAVTVAYHAAEVRVGCAGRDRCPASVQVGPPPALDGVTAADVAQVVRDYIDVDRLDLAVTGPRTYFRSLVRRGRVFTYDVTETETDL